MEPLFFADLDPGGLPFSVISNVGAVPGGEAFLFLNDSVSILFDSGFGCSGDLLVRRLSEVLHDRPLDYILLSHSHYDHAPGSAWCTARWPSCRVVAGKKTQSVFGRPGAVATMRRLDQAASVKFCISSSVDRFSELRVDIAPDDGECFAVGDQDVQLLLLPGHTNCSVGYWFPSCGLLLSSESIGTFYEGSDRVASALLTGFEDGIRSIRRCMGLPLNHICIPHCSMLHGKDCSLFLEQSLKNNTAARDTIVAAYNDGADREALRTILKNMWYVGRCREIQPEEAFDENSGYVVDTILREYAVTV